VAVGDYNYYFDHGALLHGLAAANAWRAALLVDEAHNLVERARAMYSAELDQAALKALRKSTPALKPALDRVNRHWNALLREQPAAQVADYAVLPAAPTALLNALQQAVNAINAYLAEHAAQPLDAELQRFYFDATVFGRLAESYDTHSLFDLARRRGGSTLALRNIIPAPFLAPRFAAAHATVLFSATLSPAKFYSDTLGLPADTPWIDVESPFRAEQLTVRIVRDVSTRYTHRDDSVAPIGALIARRFASHPGNYLAFFSSFDYLRQVLTWVRQRHPETPVWEQTRAMDEAARAAFLARFVPGGAGIGFAVLGGAFGEGVDLPGDRLVGAFIATLGLPQVNPWNEQVRERMEAAFGSGYDYAYLFPGIRKVVQAAGRVIRSPSDRGIVTLIDDRFVRQEVRDLLPGWWRPEVVRAAAEA
jgi:Rad3-related DNA helicase